MMTLGRLKKLVDKLVAEGYERKRVYIRKDTFSHPCEDDGCLILDVDQAFMQTFPILDDDGFDTGKCQSGLILVGDSYDPREGETK